MRRTPAIDGGRGRGPAILALGVLAFLVVWILFLPPFSVLRGEETGVTGTDGLTTTTRDDVPDLPDGLEAVSPLYDVNVKPEFASQPTVLTVSLDRAVDSNATVNLYTYEDEQYRIVSTATLVFDDTAVQGPVDSVPANVIALRRVEFSYTVSGWLPAEAELDSDADRNISWLNPATWEPDLEGGLRPLANARADAGRFKTAPTIQANTPAASENANVIMQDQELRDFHIEIIMAALVSGSFDGVTIDYRDLTDANRENFARFIASLADAMHQENMTLFVTLPFPDVDEAGVVDSGAYDWKNIALAADFVNLMPERDQRLYRTSMMAALRQFTEGDAIDPHKILLVLSPYSGETTEDGIRPHSLGSAMALATQLEVKGIGEITTGDRVTIQAPHVSSELSASGLAWSDETLCVEFTWPASGGDRTIWIENQYSAAFKLLLVERFGLAGIAVEDVSEYEFGADLWPAILAFLNTDGEPTVLKPHPETMAIEWGSDGGTLSGGSTGIVTWQAPSNPGTYTVWVVLGDGVVRMGNELEIEVVGQPGDDTATPSEDDTETPTATETPGE